MALLWANGGGNNGGTAEVTQKDNPYLDFTESIVVPIIGGNS